MHLRRIAASFLVAVPGVGLVAACGVVVLGGSAAAQSTAVLGKKDAAFASLLKQAGYTDLAEKLVGTIEKSGQAGANEAVDLRALHLDLRLDIAQRETDPIKRKELLKSILEEKENLVAQFSGRKVGEEASNTLPDVYRLVGEAVSVAIQKEKDPNKIKDLVKEGSEIYTKAEESMQSRLEKLKGLPSDPVIEQQMAALLFNLPRTYYYHALLFNKEEFRRKDLLGKAITGFQALGLEVGSDNVLTYEGAIFEGLCDKELGEFDKAKEALASAIEFPKNLGLELNKQGYYDLDVVAANCIADATLQMVLMLTELKDPAGAIEWAKKFLDTTNGALETQHGLAVLAAKAEAHLALGDQKGASDCADKLVAADPRGPWGAEGRRLQGKLLQTGTVDSSKALDIARTYQDRGEVEKALQIAHLAIASAKGNPKEASLSVDGYLLISRIFRDRGWVDEAALACDAAYERYPGSEKAPEALYQSISLYMQLNKDAKRPFYKKRIEEKQKTLSTRFATHPLAQSALLFQGKELAADGKLLEAADFFSKVQPTSSNFLEAQFWAGDAYKNYAVTLLKDPNKVAEAKTYVTQAETFFKKVITDVEPALAKPSNDFDARGRLETLGLNARKGLALLYLTKGVDRPNDVLTLLENVDERYKTNASALSDFWSFRIKALESTGKVDEAMTRLDALAKKDPKSRAIAGAAGIVAASLDTRAAELREKDKAKADELQRKAAAYYAMAGGALLDSENPNTKQVEIIAGRLLALGLDANEVPQDLNTFVGWDPKNNKDTTLWTVAAGLYDKSLSLSPNYVSRANLGRLYGFLGKWDKAATEFGKLFDQEHMLTKEGKLDTRLVSSKPELLGAYFESGVAEYMVAMQSADADRFRRAQTVFDVLVQANSVNPGRTWWWAKYYQIRGKIDAGFYAEAQTLYNRLDRESTGFGAQFGLAQKFGEIRAELEKRGLVTPKPSIPPPEPPKKKDLPKDKGEQPK